MLPSSLPLEDPRGAAFTRAPYGAMRAYYGHEGQCHENAGALGSIDFQGVAVGSLHASNFQIT